VSYVRISPDRKDVAFIHHPSRGNDAGEVRLLRMDGSGGARSLSPVFETCLGLDWNAQTHEIWFTATSAPHRGTLLLAVDSSGRQRSVQMLPEPTVLESVSADGRRCLLNVRDDRMILAVRQGRRPPTDLTWLGMSLAADVSPDGKMVLFWDGGGSEKSSGAWVRPLDGTDAVWLGAGEPHRFSPDGHFLVAVNRTEAGGARFDVIPVGAGTSRSIMPPDGESESPSFSGGDGLLFTRHVAGRNHIWKIQLDGKGAGPLGLSDCNNPVASPAADVFLAICGPGSSAIDIQSTSGPERRRIFELPPGDAFLYARWNAVGDRVFGVTTGRRMLTLDASNGRLVAEEGLPSLGKGEAAVLDGAGLSSDASVQAYSAKRISSRLYLAEGLR
jgi:Tol biopolymer transport system component